MAGHEAGVCGPGEQLVGCHVQDVLQGGHVAHGLQPEEVGVLRRPGGLMGTAPLVVADQEVAVLQVRPSDGELAEQPLDPLAQPVQVGRMARAGAVLRPCAVGPHHAGLGMSAQEGLDVVRVVSFVVDAPVPGGTDARDDGHAPGGGIFGDSPCRLCTAVAVAQESPDDYAFHAEPRREVCEATVILDISFRTLEVPVVTAEVERARVVQHPVRAVVPGPEVGVGQGRRGSVKVPDHALAHERLLADRAMSVPSKLSVPAGDARPRCGRGSGCSTQGAGTSWAGL